VSGRAIGRKRSGNIIEGVRVDSQTGGVPTLLARSHTGRTGPEASRRATLRSPRRSRRTALNGRALRDTTRRSSQPLRDDPARSVSQVQTGPVRCLTPERGRNGDGRSAKARSASALWRNGHVETAHVRCLARAMSSWRARYHRGNGRRRLTRRAPGADRGPARLGP
jgi:hypothetical protein